jgi:hypothetical protein
MCGVAMEMQKWVPTATLSGCKISHTAVNDMNGLASLCKVVDDFVRF